MAVVAESAAVLAAARPFGDPLGSLNDGERARLTRLRVPQDRHDLVAARVLARLLVVHRDGRPPGAAALASIRLHQRCPECGGPHGRPEVSGRTELGLSWAHARGLVAAAVADGPVGIDVERRDGEVPRLDGRSDGAAAASLAAWLGWTRGEALVKAGLTDLDEVQRWPLAGPPSRHAAVAVPELVQRCRDRGYSLIGLSDQVGREDGVPDVVVSVASHAPAEFVHLDRLVGRVAPAD